MTNNIDRRTFLGASGLAIAAAGTLGFSARRAFAQPVPAAEVTSVLQRTAGVRAVVLDALYLANAPALPNAVLTAARARYDGATLARAQLLTLDPDLIVLGWME